MKEETKTTTIIPAQPGWSFALVCFDGNRRPWLSHRPVIAWDIERSESARVLPCHGATPIIADRYGINRYGNHEWVLRDPDGKYHRYGHDGSWDSEEAVLKEFAEREAMSKAKPTQRTAQK